MELIEDFTDTAEGRIISECGSGLLVIEACRKLAIPPALHTPAETTQLIPLLIQAILNGPLFFNLKVSSSPCRRPLE